MKTLTKLLMSIIPLVIVFFSSASYAVTVDPTYYGSAGSKNTACWAWRGTSGSNSGCSSYIEQGDGLRRTQNRIGNRACYGGSGECKSKYFFWYTSGGCPAYTDPVTQECTTEPTCQFGSLSPECRVDCPRKEYTYTQDGVIRSGVIGAGTVGFGQSCPSPSFPAGSSSGCVGSPGACADFEGAVPEGTPVVIEDSSTSTTESGDGSSTSSGSTSTSTSGGGSSTSTTGGTTTGTDGKNSNGVPIDPDAINNSGGPSDLSDQQINLGGETYQLCNDGSVANTTSGCDYTPNNCGPNQIDTVYGCYDLPNPEPPPDSDPETTTTTTTSTPVDNGDGTTTTTTTTTTISTGGITDGEPTDEEDNRNASGSSGCDAPPTCSGDAIDCALLVQEWKTTCNAYESVTSANDCVTPPVCDGDPIECALLKQQWEEYCATEQSISDMPGDAETHFSSQGLDDLETLAPGSLFDEISNGDSEKDIETELGNFLDYTSITGTCPSPQQVNIGQFGSFDFSYQFLCDFASLLRYVVILGAFLVGGTIVLRSFTS